MQIQKYVILSNKMCRIINNRKVIFEPHHEKTDFLHIFENKNVTAELISPSVSVTYR